MRKLPPNSGRPRPSIYSRKAGACGKKFGRLVGVLLFCAIPDRAVRAAEPTEAPRRAVSTIPSVVETLFALGQGDRLVGVSPYCRFPPEALQKAKVGSFHDANLETILALEPDWVALFDTQEKIAAVLEKMNCRVYRNSAETLEEVYSVIRDLGAEFRVPDRAERLVASIRNEIESIEERLAGLPTKRVLYVVQRQPGALQQIYCVGRGNFMNEMIEAAGGVNCVEASLGRYPILSKENVILADPETILDVDPSRQGEEIRGTPEEWKTLSTVKAVRADSVHRIDDAHLSIPGPGIPRNVRRIAVLIHGEEARSRLAEEDEEGVE